MNLSSKLKLLTLAYTRQACKCNGHAHNVYETSHLADTQMPSGVVLGVFLCEDSPCFVNLLWSLRSSSTTVSKDLMVLTTMY